MPVRLGKGVRDDAPDLWCRPVTAREVSQHGRPAEALSLAGMPSYESENGKILVMDLVVVFDRGPMHAPMAIPNSYYATAARAPTGLAPLHDDPDALWTWRPVLYFLGLWDTSTAGSQHELEWRIGAHEATVARSDLDDLIGEYMVKCALAKSDPEDFLDGAKRIEAEWKADPPPLPFIEANWRADRLLREFLSPQQLLDLEASNEFYVRGTINKLYKIRVNAGADVVHPETRETLLSLCLHTDEWIPPADVALATKLAIESGRDGEEEMLEGARVTMYKGRTRATRAERAAWERERHLLPTPL